MAPKHEGDPLKLIHILPSEPDSPRFRVQIGTERAPIWLAGLAYLWRITQAGITSFISAIQWVGRHGRKGLQLLGMSMRFLKDGVLLSGQKISPWGTKLRNKITKLLNGIGPIYSDQIKERWRRRGRKRPTPPEPLVKIAPVKKYEFPNQVNALQDQLVAQQHELTRVSAQMSELQALVLSQQQVLLHLGKDLEAAEMRAKTPEQIIVPRKPKTRTARNSKPKKTSSQKQPPPTPPLGMEVTS